MEEEIYNEITLDAKVEALLFFKGEPLSVKKIAKLFKVKDKEVGDALEILNEKFQGRGLQLIFKEGEVMLGTHKDLGPFFETLRKEELTKELSKASLETLSVILYKDGVTRGDIDYIRGVNSSFILRSLLVRGLVERKTHSADSRKYVYKPTFDLLSFLGLSKIEDLPEYSEVTKGLSERVEEETEEIEDSNPPLGDGQKPEEKSGSSNFSEEAPREEAGEASREREVHDTTEESPIDNPEESIG